MKNLISISFLVAVLCALPGFSSAQLLQVYESGDSITPACFLSDGGVLGTFQESPFSSSAKKFQEGYDETLFESNYVVQAISLKDRYTLLNLFIETGTTIVGVVDTLTGEYVVVSDSLETSEGVSLLTHPTTGEFAVFGTTTAGHDRPNLPNCGHSLLIAAENFSVVKNTSVSPGRPSSEFAEGAVFSPSGGVMVGVYSRKTGFDFKGGYVATFSSTDGSVLSHYKVDGFLRMKGIIKAQEEGKYIIYGNTYLDGVVSLAFQVVSVDESSGLIDILGERFTLPDVPFEPEAVVIQQDRIYFAGSSGRYDVSPETENNSPSAGVIVFSIEGQDDFVYQQHYVMSGMYEGYETFFVDVFAEGHELLFLANVSLPYWVGAEHRYSVFSLAEYTDVGQHMEKESFDVYPNPSSIGEVFVTAKNSGILRLTNMQGKLVREQRLSSGVNRISLDGLSTGMYSVVFGDKRASSLLLKTK